MWACPEGEAKKRGMAVDTYFKELTHVDHAIADGEEGGFVKVHTEKGTDRIVGATIVAHSHGRDDKRNDSGDGWKAWSENYLRGDPSLSHSS